MSSAEVAREAKEILSELYQPGGLEAGTYPALEQLVQGELGLKWDPELGMWMKYDEHKADINTVFEYWRERREQVLDLPPGPRMNLTGKRRSKIKARLDEGYTVNQLKEAIDGMLSRDYNVENGYTDIELCLRNQSKVEQFRQHLHNYKSKKQTIYKIYEATR